ncbi:hypothetical protein QBC44DRAFT_247948, partial [Cladorrhinum sp. PSN332]
IVIMADSKPPISFIGLGAMGFGMATHLIKQGYKVTGFDVWAPTLKKFEAAGGISATTPAEAVAGKDFSVVMVATAQQAQSVLLDGPSPAVSSLPQGAVVLLCSTVPSEYVQALQAQLQAIGRGDILLVDSPVSGGAARAADGTLSIMAGASDAALEKARPLLAELSDPAKLYIVQGGIGAGSNMKMVHQVLAANQILSASEVLGFADRLGVDLAKAQQAVLTSDAWNWMFEHRTPRIFTQFQPVASAVQIIVKDTGIITAEGRRSGFPTPMTSAAEQVYFAAIGRGYAMDDDSSLIRLYIEGKDKAGALHGTAESEDEKLALVVGLMKGILLASVAESLAFAHAVKLDLNQVFELCVNAAGGSKVLEKLGPAIIAELYGKEAVASGGEANLERIVSELQAAVEEAQRIKAPLFLGSQALNILRRVTVSSRGALSVGAVVKAGSPHQFRERFPLTHSISIPATRSRLSLPATRLIFKNIIIMSKLGKTMREVIAHHFFHHGKPESDPAEMAKCHFCQIRTFATHKSIPIAIINDNDDVPMNPDFKFIDHSVVSKDVPIAEDSFRTGCDCPNDEECMYGSCQCLDEMEDESDQEDNKGRRQKFAYYWKGPKAGLMRPKYLEGREPIYECHDACACSLQCPNRVVQRGRTVPLTIFRTANRGWGVKSPVDIKKGQFVDRYLGEIITCEEGNRRRAESTIASKKDVYLFALDKFSDITSPDPWLRSDPREVDGEWMSGPTRFINHSCDPNMRIFARVGDKVDKHIHDLALFAVKDIPAGEELTFDYVDGRVDEVDQDTQDPEKIKDMTPCLCGTEKCRGFLW